jgi:pyruvate dehydrogenase E2 component (dihydrolipoyllysine-residue acetyltransferase)
VSDVVMPRLSDSMEEGTILRWLKGNGDAVDRGEELVEIETDKANMTYEADSSGVLEIVAQEGETLPIGAPIARIGGGSAASDSGQRERRAGPVDRAGASAAEPAEASAPTPPARATSAPTEAGVPSQPATSAAHSAQQREGSEPASPSAPQPSAPAHTEDGGNGRVKASPVARRLARKLGVDLGSLQGSGPGGRIVKADVEARAQAPAEAPAAAQAVPTPVASGEAGTGKGEATTVELTRTQQTIARRMAEAKATVPDFHVTTEADMAAAVALREQMKALASEEHPAPSFNDMVVKAAALALREQPRANGAYKDGRFELYSRVNVGVAVAAQDALIVPTVFDADQKSLGEIARETRALATRVREGQITPPELSGGTFTVSNLGMFGVTQFTAIINQGQAGILSVGALRDTPVVENGQIVPGKRMALTLACDHRILYGADAAELLARIRVLLESPLALAL